MEVISLAAALETNPTLIYTTRTLGKGAPKNTCCPEHCSLHAAAADTDGSFFRNTLGWRLSSWSCQQLLLMPTKNHAKLVQDMDCSSSTPEGAQEPWTTTRGGDNPRETSIKFVTQPLLF